MADSIPISKTVDTTLRSVFKIKNGEDGEEVDLHVTKINNEFQFTHNRIEELTRKVNNDIFGNIFNGMGNQRMSSEVAQKLADIITEMNHGRVSE
jgi:hypothetical protein